MAPMTPRGSARAVAAVALVLGLTGCGSASPSSPPSGVDGLVIPTPDPRPADFVDTVDNPWFPLVPGTTWEYDATPDTPARDLTLLAEEGPEVAGVPTTALVRTDSAGVATRDLYAQDRDGNVWWFGREGEWLAGAAGAEAGLAMPAHPRRGDGFRMALAPGVIAHAEVAAVDRELDVPLGHYRPVVVLDVTEGAAEHLAQFARGTGLVKTDDAALVRTARARLRR